MDTLGLNLGFLLIQLLNIIIIGIWPILSLVALFALRRKHLKGTNQALWVLMIVAIPVLGALALFIIKPNESNPS